MSRIAETVAQYGALETCKLADVTYRQLDYWDRIGLVKPSLHEAMGQGSLRVYSAADVCVVKAIGMLLDAGLSLAAARRVVESKEPDKVLTKLTADVQHAIRTMSGAAASV